MGDYTPTQSNRPPSIITGTLPPALLSRLDSESVEIMASEPSTVIDLIENLPALLAEATRRADIKGIQRALSTRFEIYPQPHRSAEQWALWWAPYIRALQDLPADVIEQAMRTWELDGSKGFFPKPGELADLARETQTPALRRYAKASQVIREAERGKPRPSGYTITPPGLKTIPERERVKAMAKEFVDAVKAKRPPVKEIVPIQGKLAEGMGITEGLRDLMKSRWGDDCFDQVGGAA